MTFKTRHWDRIGNGGLTFTELGMGTAPLGNLYRSISDDEAHAICTAMGEGHPVSIGDLITDPRDRERQLACLPLLLIRNGSRTTMPNESTHLKRGDQLLVCGRRRSNTIIQRSEII